MRKNVLLIALVLIVMVSLLALPAMAEDSRSQCVCGGKATGKTGHTCEEVTFEPWTSTTSLPSSGNYYLTDNVTITNYRTLSGNLNLDLNGHNITRTVTSNNTSQVFAVAASYSLSITDSTANPGTLSRDLSTMTEDAKKAITNWGLLIIVNKNYTGSLNLYDGIYDSTGCYSYGGSIISNSSTTYPINIYGGKYYGGITTHNGTTGGTAGAVYSSSNVNMYGGEITGATLITRTGVTESGAGLRTTGTLTIGGDAKIYGNYRKMETEDAAAEPNNVYVTSNTKVVFSGKYTGEIGLVTSGVNPNGTNGVKVASSANSGNIASAKVHIDGKEDTHRAYQATSIYMAQFRTQCECGGKAEGKPGHTCEDIEFIAWNHSSSCPTSGNYYLVTNLTHTSTRRDISNNTLRIDLNGKNLTRKPAAGTNACMFGMAGTSKIVFTDSTETPGTITRDLTDFGSTSCSNYGMIVYIDKSATNSSLFLYGGILDSTGTSTTGAGSSIYNGSATTTVNIYGGQIKGGTATNGVIFSAGPVVLMGGKISGGVMTNTSSAAIDGGCALTLGGDPIVTGNTLSDGTAANIKLATGNLTVKDTFTGNVTITPASALSLDTVLGKSDNAAIQGVITLEGYPDYSIRIVGNDLVVSSGYKTLVDAGMNTLYYDSLTDAIAEYEGGKAVIKLLDDASKDNITITQDTYIDLNGYDLGSVTVTAGTLFLYDSQTDDFTVEDGRGYGKVGAVEGDVKALPSGELFKNGYLMITENDGVSFHRLSVDTTGVSLRVTDIATNGAAIYYQSGFGGDEVIQDNVVAFGIAMGAGKAPDFRAKTYTRTTDMTKWESGKLNTFNSTLLKNIMKVSNSYSTNNKNSSTQVYSQAYIELEGGTRILGGSYKLSLKQIMEGTETTTGIDGLWETLDSTKKQPVIAMFNQFQDVMTTWKIPYIKHEITGEEIPYDDDGILKVLLIGHSLGLDSGYFFPEVYKETTGKEVVVGMIYHSGCRLNQHVYYINNNIKQYAYYEYDTRVDTNWRRADARASEDAAMTFHAVEPSAANDTLINDGVIGVTMKDGITRADWDIVIMQAGVFDAAGKQDDANYAVNTTADIRTIQQYVLDNDIEKRSVPEFGWNITWASPSSDASFWDSSENYVQVYIRHNTNFYWQYGKDANDMYADIASVYANDVAAAYDWDYLMPSGTALHNCKSVMADEDLYRDVIHTNDFGRLMAAYIWTCQIEGITMDDIPEITSIYSQLRYYAADRRSGDYALNSSEQAILRKAVNAALANPLKLTDLSN